MNNERQESIRFLRAYRPEFGGRMQPLSQPLQPPMWAMATLKMSRAELRQLLGEPHYIETDGRRTCGGEEDVWAFTFPSGDRVLLVCDPISGAGIWCDPPSRELVLTVLGAVANDSRLVFAEEPTRFF